MSSQAFEPGQPASAVPPVPPAPAVPASPFNTPLANVAITERERTQSRARDLLSLAAALSEAITLDEVADAMFGEGLRAVGADAGSLALVSETNGALQFRMIRSTGYSGALEAASRHMQVTPGRPLSDAILSRAPVLIPSGAEWDIRYPEVYRTSIVMFGYEAFVALPVVIGDRAVAAISFSFRATRAFDDEAITLLATIGKVCAQALDRARSFEAERRARGASQFLAEASRVLSLSLDYETTMRNLATAAVPTVADWCSIDIVRDGAPGAWPPDVRRVALVHEDPRKVAWARELRLTADWDSPSGLARVLRDGVSEFIPEVTDETLRAATSDESRLALLRELRLSSVIIVPLKARRRTLGALTLVMSESARRYDEQDLAVAEDLARRAATAIDNAELYIAAVNARRAAERAADRTRRLQTLTASFARALTDAEVLDVVVEQGIVAVGAQAGIVMLLSDDGTILNPVRSVGYPEEAVDLLRALPIDAPYPSREVIRTGNGVFIETAADWSASYAPPVWSRSSMQAAAMLPLAGSSRTLGLVSIRYSDEHRFDDDERDFLTALGRQCGQALERAHLLRAERVARDEAERANQAKMQFLATMSHELRTPLNAIGGYTELLEMGVRGPLTMDQRVDLQRIQRSQKHLLSLINDVLNFARIDAGKLEVNMGPVNVHETIAALEPLVAPQLHAKRLSFDTGSADGDVRALADDDKLRQVLLNLLSNAVKFTADGGRITTTCVCDAAGVRISVSDTGVGIANQDLERIFDPFVQLERRLTNTVGGTGLGLAISRDLARAMGGDVTVESVAGAGSTFTVHLRCATP